MRPLVNSRAYQHPRKMLSKRWALPFTPFPQLQSCDSLLSAKWDFSVLSQSPNPFTLSIREQVSPVHSHSSQRVSPAHSHFQSGGEPTIHTLIRG